MFKDFPKHKHLPSSAVTSINRNFLVIKQLFSSIFPSAPCMSQRGDSSVAGDFYRIEHDVTGRLNPRGGGGGGAGRLDFCRQDQRLDTALRLASDAAWPTSCPTGNHTADQIE